MVMFFISRFAIQYATMILDPDIDGAHGSFSNREQYSIDLFQINLNRTVLK
jgi:hypothetical protein